MFFLLERLTNPTKQHDDTVQLAPCYDTITRTSAIVCNNVDNTMKIISRYYMCHKLYTHYVRMDQFRLFTYLYVNGRAGKCILHCSFAYILTRY